MSWTRQNTNKKSLNSLMVFSITSLIQQLVLCFYAALQVFSRSGSAKKQWFKPQKFLNLLQECLCLSGFGDTITGTSLPMAPHICLFSLFQQPSVLTTIPTGAQNQETLKAGIYKELIIPQHQTPSADAVSIHQSSAPSGHIQF